MTTQSKERIDTITFLKDARRLAHNARQTFDADWKENLNFWIGNQRPTNQDNFMSPWRSRSISNIIFPAVEQIHALMTDERPIAFVEKRANGTQRMSNVLHGS